MTESSQSATAPGVWAVLDFTWHCHCPRGFAHGRSDADCSPRYVGGMFGGATWADGCGMVRPTPGGRAWWARVVPT